MFVLLNIVAFENSFISLSVLAVNSVLHFELFAAKSTGL